MVNRNVQKGLADWHTLWSSVWMEDTTMDRLRYTNAETNDETDKEEQDGASDQVPLRSG